MIYQPDWILKDKFRHLVQVNDYQGGHFAALEVPRTLAEDIWMGVGKIEGGRGVQGK